MLKSSNVKAKYHTSWSREGHYNKESNKSANSEKHINIEK